MRAQLPDFDMPFEIQKHDKFKKIIRWFGTLMGQQSQSNWKKKIPCLKMEDGEWAWSTWIYISRVNKTLKYRIINEPIDSWTQKTRHKIWRPKYTWEVYGFSQYQLVTKNMLPLFYRKALRSWTNFVFITIGSVSREDVLKQRLFG